MIGFDFVMFRAVGGRGESAQFSVGPVGGVGVAGLAALSLLLQTARLTALSRTSLSVLSQVMVQQLRVRLLMRRENVQERSRGVTGGSSGIQGPGPAQRRGQTEGRRRPSVEALLIEGLSLAVDGSSHVGDSAAGA